MTATIPVAPARAPTTDDARKAADALAAAGAGCVLLFGSVARCQATPDSDIDLVAVFDDIDYSDRPRMRETLRAAAEAASGWECGVVVTDRPEWAVRVSNVTSSFEHAISKEAVVMFDNPPGEVDWDKRQVKPATNRQEALDCLRNCLSPILDRLDSAMFQKRWLEMSNRSSKVREKSRLDRLRSMCENSAVTVELALKALATLAGEHPISEKQMEAADYDIRKCLRQVPQSYRNRIFDVASGFGLNLVEMSRWRTLATYPENIYAERAYADRRVDDYVRVALSVAMFATSEIENRADGAEASDCREMLEDMAARFCEHDIRYGLPLDRPDPRKVPAAAPLSPEQPPVFDTPAPAFVFPASTAGGSSASDMGRRARTLKRRGVGNNANARKLGITEAQAHGFTPGMPPGRN